MTFDDWATGVLNGIGAPVDAANLDTLFAWATAESGSDVMRWLNPLNTTQELLTAVDIDPDMNRVGVEAYPTVQDGVIATIATLLNGRYPTIVSHLRNSVPRSQWGDACGELGTWGTGCGWLNANYGPVPGGAIGGPEVLSADDPIVKQWYLNFSDLLTKVDALYNFMSQGEFAKFNEGFDKLLAAVQALPAGADNTAVLAAIADLKAHPATVLDPTLLQKIESIEANLNAPRPPA